MTAKETQGLKDVIKTHISRTDEVLGSENISQQLFEVFDAHNSLPRFYMEAEK